MDLEKDNPFVSYYSIHGITLRLNTNNGYIHSPIDELLASFASEKEPLVSDIDFHIYDTPACHDGVSSMPNDLKLLYSPSKKDKFDITLLGIQTFNIYVNEADFTYYMDLGETGRLSYSLKDYAANGYIHTPESISPKVIPSTLFMFVFNQMLKSKNYFPIHCSVVEKEGKGILMPGFSGAGKTTTSISLIRSGYGFLGDDRPILHYDKDNNLEMLSFPEEINVTEKTIGFFPELADGEFIKTHKGMLKKSFNAEDIYPGSLTERCRPKAVLFPEITPVSKSYVEEMSKSDALSLFLPHTMLVFDKETSNRHFNILFDLISSVDTYRLKLGSDILALPELVEAIL